MHLDLVADRLGADTLMAGAGDDRINAGTGADVVHGGADADEIYGLAGTDTLFGDGAAQNEAASFEGFINSHDAIEPGFMQSSANDSGLQRKIRNRCRPDRFDTIKSRMHTKAMTKRMEKTLSC